VDIWFNESGVVVVGFNLNINVEWQNNKNNNKKKEKKKEAMLDVDGLIKVGGYMV
jgi:exopolysaccharide biosynthesis protein